MVETMGSRIRDLRMLRGLTQEELAFLLYRKKNTIRAKTLNYEKMSSDVSACHAIISDRKYVDINLIGIFGG